MVFVYNNDDSGGSFKLNRNDVALFTKENNLLEIQTEKKKYAH